MSTKQFLVLLIFFLALPIFWAQEKAKTEQKPSTSPASSTAAPPHVPYTFVISAEDTARKNPFKFTEASVERGKKVFETQCAMCHGTNADGKGEVAKEMQINPPDFTKAETLKNRTDGDLFAIISSGSQIMPSQEKRLTEKHKWQIVNFLRAAGGKKPELGGEKEKEQDINELVVSH